VNASARKSPLPPFPVLAAAALAVAAFFGLYAWLPYATGYGDARVTILRFARWVWDGGEDWQHCYLVPLAIAAIIYFDRRKLSTIPIAGSSLGLVAVVFGFFVYWVGYRVDNIYIGYASFQILAGASVLWILGWRWMMALAFPWMFLVFLYPLPFLDNFVAFPLRMVMSNASAFVLDVMGIDVVRQGTGLISAPDPVLGVPAGARFSVDVADPCSGIRSLFALMMVSALYGHFTLRSWWQKSILFFCSIPLAVAGNLVRILALTLGTIAFGAEFAIGKHALTDPSWFHMAAGYLVFGVALAGMAGIAGLLTNFRRIGELKTRAERVLETVSAAAPPPGSVPPASTAAASPAPKREDLY